MKKTFEVFLKARSYNFLFVDPIYTNKPGILCVVPSHTVHGALETLIWL